MLGVIRIQFRRAFAAVGGDQDGGAGDVLEMVDPAVGAADGEFIVVRAEYLQSVAFVDRRNEHAFYRLEIEIAAVAGRARHAQRRLADWPGCDRHLCRSNQNDQPWPADWPRPFCRRVR